MGHRIKIIGFAFIFLLIVSCSIPVSIPIDFDGLDGKDQEKSPPSEIAEKPALTPTTGPLDCGLDLDCFFGALYECQESSVEYTQTLDMMGTEIFSSLHFEVTGPESGQCQFSVKTAKVLVSYSEEAI